MQLTVLLPVTSSCDHTECSIIIPSLHCLCNISAKCGAVAQLVDRWASN